MRTVVVFHRHLLSQNPPCRAVLSYLCLADQNVLQAPESVRGLLRQASRFFRKEHVAAGAILADTNVPSSSEKLYFIGAGSVDLQVSRGGGGGLGA